MAKYQFNFTQTASASVEVEAEDYDEALDLAYEEVPGGVCAQCSGWGREYSLDLNGDWDVSDTHYVDGVEVSA